jgi:hypothetical protein
MSKKLGCFIIICLGFILTFGLRLPTWAAQAPAARNFFARPAETALSADATTNCQPLRYDGQGSANRINIVLVPSGFQGDLARFASEAKRIWAEFEKYSPFQPGIKELNVFYVNREWPVNNFCYRINPAAPQFVACEPFVAKALSNDCGDELHETLVISNDSEYGGGGLFWPVNFHVAAVTLSPEAPLVAIHEMSHTMFGFGDEYQANYNVYSTGKRPNCDVAGCPKWRDLIGKIAQVGCYPGFCQGGKYSVGDPHSMMNDYGNYSPNQVRFICCLYQARTGVYPPLLCSPFQRSDLTPLGDYCAANPVDARLLQKNYEAIPLDEVMKIYPHFPK